MRYYEPFEDADGEISLLQVDVEPGHHSWRVITAGEIYAAGTDPHERKFYERQIEGAAWPLPRKLDPVGGMDQDWAKLEQDIVRYLHAHIWNLHVLARVPTMFEGAHHPMFWPAL